MLWVLAAAIQFCCLLVALLLFSCYYCLLLFNSLVHAIIVMYKKTNFIIDCCLILRHFPWFYSNTSFHLFHSPLFHIYPHQLLLVYVYALHICIIAIVVLINQYPLNLNYVLSFSLSFSLSLSVRSVFWFGRIQTVVRSSYANENYLLLYFFNSIFFVAFFLSLHI